MNFCVVSAKAAGLESSARSYLLAISQTTTVAWHAVASVSRGSSPVITRSTCSFDNLPEKNDLARRDRLRVVIAIDRSAATKAKTAARIEGSGWKNTS